MVWIELQDVMQMSCDGKMMLVDVFVLGIGGVFQFFSCFFSLEDNEIICQKVELVCNVKNECGIEDVVMLVYMLLENLMLVGSQVMMVLLGWVLIDGKVIDFYLFKVLIGKDNLMVNGIQLFDVEGVIVLGMVIGDWMFFCVWGDV